MGKKFGKIETKKLMKVIRDNETCVRLVVIDDATSCKDTQKYDVSRERVDTQILVLQRKRK